MFLPSPSATRPTSPTARLWIAVWEDADIGNKVRAAGAVDLAVADEQGTFP